ncbi:hypothetical protein L2E82_53895 [Cichorium intybus]|nr:hypothetical protein L2E82_53895 [Cichorium intybus]
MSLEESSLAKLNDLVEQFDEDESEWGTDLELEDYSGDTVVKESIQFPMEKVDVDENAEEQLESDGHGQFSGETKFITTDQGAQAHSSGKEDNFEVDEDDDSIVQHTILENYSNVYSNREGENTDFNTHVGVKENAQFSSDQHKRDDEKISLLSDQDKCQGENQLVKDASSHEVENIKVMG